MEQNLSWGEIIICQRIADEVADNYRMKHGRYPMDAGEAQEAVRDAHRRCVLSDVLEPEELESYMEQIVSMIGIMAEG